MWTLLFGPLLAMNVSVAAPSPAGSLAAWTKIKSEAKKIAKFKTVQDYLENLKSGGNLTAADAQEIEVFMAKHGFSRSAITSPAEIGSARIKWGRYSLTLMADGKLESQAGQKMSVESPSALSGLLEQIYRCFIPRASAFMLLPEASANETSDANWLLSAVLSAAAAR